MCAQVSLLASGSRRQRSDRSNFDPPAFGSVIRARPKLYHSLPARRGKFSDESSPARIPKFRHGLRRVPTLGTGTSGHTVAPRLREPSLELFEMDQLIRNMLSVPISTHRSQDLGPDLQEFGVL